MSIFDLRGTPNQVRLVQAALDRCDFPFERLVPELTKQWGKSQILVQWADLSVSSSVIEEVRPEGRAHKGGPDVVGRHRTLGTAWTDGRIYIDHSCESDPELAAEVLLSEAGHQVDFFYLDDQMREAIWDVYHQELDSSIGDHGHGWFDISGYETWVGESWMGGFTRGWSDVRVFLDQFTHATTDDVARKLRQIVTPDLGPPPWDQTTEPAPEPTPEPSPEPSPEEPEPREPSAPWWKRLWSWLLHLLQSGGR